MSANSTVEATIDMASVDSGDQTRDDHLRSGDFFDVANLPHAHYRSTTVTWDESKGTLTGDLTIRDVTHPVTLDVEFLGAVLDPWGNDRAVFSATGPIDREDWDLTWNMALETGGLLVSKEIQLELHVELVRRDNRRLSPRKKNSSEAILGSCVPCSELLHLGRPLRRARRGRCGSS